MPPFNQISKPNCTGNRSLQESQILRNAQKCTGFTRFLGFPFGLEGAVLAPAALARLCVWINSTCVARTGDLGTYHKNRTENTKVISLCSFFQITFLFASFSLLFTSHPTELHHPAAAACQETSPDIPKDQRYGKDRLYPTTR